jgi:glycerol-3-phosphate acyltransferase PlsY
MNFGMTVLIGVLIVYMHKSNIERLMAGTENKFGIKKNTDSDKK